MWKTINKYIYIYICPNLGLQCVCVFNHVYACSKTYACILEYAFASSKQKL